jgi:ribosome modulation factor
MKYFRVEFAIDHVLATDATHAARIAFDALARPGRPDNHFALVYGEDEYAEAGDAPTVIDLTATTSNPEPITPQRIGFAARAMGRAFDACPYADRHEANQWRAGWRVADESLPGSN